MKCSCKTGPGIPSYSQLAHSVLLRSSCERTTELLKPNSMTEKWMCYRNPVLMTRALKHCVICFALCLPFANSAAAVEHKTRFDPEMVPAVRDKSVVFPLSNSRQIRRTQSGQWLLAFEIPHEG